jgi:hypothetical protein
MSPTVSDSLVWQLVDDIAEIGKRNHGDPASIAVFACQQNLMDLSGDPEVTPSWIWMRKLVQSVA